MPFYTMHNSTGAPARRAPQDVGDADPVLVIEAPDHREARRAFVTAAWRAGGFPAARLAVAWTPRAVVVERASTHPRIQRDRRRAVMVDLGSFPVGSDV